MVSKGFCRVTSTHILALIKRYRLAVGERDYYQCIPGSTDQQQQRDAVVRALRDALRVCAPECDLSSIRPLRYRPPEPLPDGQLQRAILSLLRQNSSGIAIPTIAQQLVDHYELHLNPESRSRLELRIQRYVQGQARKGLCCSEQSRWRIT